MEQIYSQRRLGFIIGLILGLGYSITSNLINKWAMPNVPLEVPWPGIFWSVFISSAFFSTLGLLAAWTDENTPSIILSAIVGTLTSSVWSTLFGGEGQPWASIILFFIFLPRVFFYIPFSWMVRWLVDNFNYHSNKTSISLIKVIPFFISFLAIMFIGSLARVSEAEQISLVRMKELIEEGITVSSRSELPESLQDVNGFVENAEGEYTFSLGENPDVLPVQRPIVNYGEEEPLIIIKFKNGFRFGCVFTPPYIMPACIGF